MKNFLATVLLDRSQKVSELLIDGHCFPISRSHRLFNLSQGCNATVTFALSVRLSVREITQKVVNEF